MADESLAVVIQVREQRLDELAQTLRRMSKETLIEELLIFNRCGIWSPSDDEMRCLQSRDLHYRCMAAGRKLDRYSKDVFEDPAPNESARQRKAKMRRLERVTAAYSKLLRKCRSRDPVLSENKGILDG